MPLTGPSPYQGTTNNPKYGLQQTVKYYYDSNGNIVYDTSTQNLLNYISGNSYLAPAFRFPDYRWATTETLPSSVTFSADIDNLAFILKNIPKGKRGFQPFSFNAFNDRIYYFNEDKVSTPGEPNTSFYLRNWGTTSSANFYPSLWCAAGVSTQYDYWKSWFNALNAQGATVDAIYMDNEGSVFEGGYLTSNRYNSIIADSRYGNSFFGFTSMQEIYLSSGATGITNALFNDMAWNATKQFYKSINFTKAFGDSFLSVYPDGHLSDYQSHHGVPYVWSRGNYPLDPNGTTPIDLNIGELFGRPTTQLKQIGNASSPVLYGWFRELGIDWGNIFFIRGDDSTKVYFPFNQVPFSYKDMFITTGPWSSFLMCMALVRDAKRGNPNIPLTPWIGSVYMTADSYVMKQIGFDSSAFYGQSPPEVLSGMWRRLNVDSLTKGFTAPDGTTSAYRLLGSAPSTVANAWYKNNVSGVTLESGSSGSFILNTVGTTGTTAAIAYYYSGLTIGTTYVFSYYIDLDRGYTGSLARFTRWNTSNVASLAPLVPNQSTTLSNVLGITFNQSLPVSTENFYKEAGISYGVGNSSWTKVAWEFVPQESGTNIGMHVYYGPNSNSITGGYTTYIKDPFLQEKISGLTLNINRLDNDLLGNTTYLIYYYNGITPGFTYTFSYYFDLSRGTTSFGTNFPYTVQSAENFYTSTYGVPRGITLTQSLPVIGIPQNNFASIGFTSGNSGWTKVEYKFKTITPYSDMEENNSLAISLYRRANIYSITNPNSSLIGLSAYIWNPELTVEYPNGTTQNISVTPLDTEFTPDTRDWRDGPAGGFCDVQKGYDSRTNIFCTQRGGNSAYYYELIRHTALHGTKSFGFFNPMSFEDMGMTGAKARGRYNQTNIDTYLTSGRTGFLQEFETLNKCMQDIHNKISGFTLATAIYTPVDWNSPYFLSGAPDITGNTWWWRITVKPGHTLYINGNTLSASNPGAWIETSGPTFAGVSFSVSDMYVQSEPGITAATKDINCLTMQNKNALISVGTNFSRGSTASYVGPSGYILYAGPNEPRFEYYPDTLQPRGLLLERTSTNLLNWSESFANTGGADNNWIDTNILRVSGVTSPQNISNAIRFTATTNNSTIISSNAVLNGACGFRSFSFWARGVTGNEKLYYTIDGGTSWVEVLNVSNKWKRMEFGPWFTGSTVEWPYTNLLNNSVNQIHHVGFKLGITFSSIEIWGAQLEDRTPVWGSISNSSQNTRRKATSYIPTQGVSAGRSVDTFSIPGACASLWMGLTQGTFIFETEAANWQTGRIYVAGSNLATWLNVEEISFYPSWSGPLVFSGTPSLQSRGYPTVRVPLDVPLKVAFTYNPVGTKLCGSGNLAYASWNNFTSFGSMSTINFVGPITGLDSIYVRRIRHWDYVLHDTDLKNMTLGDVDLKKWLNRGDGGKL